MTVNCVKCNAPIVVPNDSPKPVLNHTWYVCDACAHPQILDSPPITVTAIPLVKPVITSPIAAPKKETE